MENGFAKETVERVGAILNDSDKLLAERFRALFTLRGIGSHEAIDQICRCFKDDSALIKHECAYCLGQIQDPYAVPVLSSVLEDTAQEPMVIYLYRLCIKHNRLHQTRLFKQQTANPSYRRWQILNVNFGQQHLGSLLYAMPVRQRV